MCKTLIKNRLTAFNHQQGRCYYCGFPMWIGQPDQFALTFKLTRGAVARLQCTAEHLIARTDGGADSRDNIVAACRFCNQTRHKTGNPRNPAPYRQHVSRRVHAGRWHPAYLRGLVTLDC